MILAEFYIAQGQSMMSIIKFYFNLICTCPAILILRTYAIWKWKRAVVWLLAISWVASFAGGGYLVEKLFERGGSTFTFPHNATCIKHILQMERSRFLPSTLEFV
jgi:hypothetical protein